MSNSRRRAVAALRARYTGESHSLAASGVERGHAIGLDLCTLAQQRMRAFLALYLFNSGLIAALPDTFQTAFITGYTLLVSPQRDHLRLVTDAPANVAGRICWVGRGSGASGVPGMRLAGVGHTGSRRPSESYRLLHVPTGGSLVVTSSGHRPEESTFVDPTRNGYTDAWLQVGQPLSEGEEHRLTQWPSMTIDMCILAAGLVARLNLTDPDKRWTVGQWFWDPLRSSLGAPDLGRPDIGTLELSRHLWGNADEWDLRWEGYPFLDDLIYAMTDPAVGMPALTVRRDKRDVTLCIGSARLRLMHRPTIRPPVTFTGRSRTRMSAT